MGENKDNKLVLRNESTHAEEEFIPTQPRQPEDLQGLLRFAIEAGSQNSNRSISTVNRSEPIDPERRQFLENVLSNFSVNIIDEVKKYINILKGLSTYKEGDDVSSFIEAMDALSEYLDTSDVANDFFKLGGFDVCFGWLLRGPPSVRWRAAELIAQCCQNNPFCQNKAVESNRMKTLMDVASRDPDEKCKLKAFYSVSCIVRENPTGLIQFLSLNGHKLILSCLKSNSEKLKTKAAFLLSSIADKEPMFKDQLVDAGLVDEVVSIILESDGVNSLEYILSALCAMIENHPRAIQICKKSNNLIPYLTDISNRHSTDEAFSEELLYIKQLLNTLSS